MRVDDEGVRAGDPLPTGPADSTVIYSATLLVEGKHALTRLTTANEIGRPARYLASDRQVIPIP